MPPIPEVPLEDLKPLLRECIHAARSIAQADLYALSWNGEEAVLKDFSGRPWWIRRFYAPFVLAREFRALRRLQGVTGIPRLFASAGPYAFLMERLNARRLPRDREHPPSAEFFDRAMALVAELHDRGIGHGDLRRLNIMIDAEERPYLIDFATAVTSKPGLEGVLSRFLFRRYRVIDRVKMIRIKSEFYPDRLTPEERTELAAAPWYLNFGRTIKKRVLRLRKPHHRRRLARQMKQKMRGGGAGPTGRP